MDRFVAIWLTLLMISSHFAHLHASDQKPVDFQKKIQPIFASRCLKCHGPDQETQAAGLRLDDRESATTILESEETAIVPGKPEESAILERISSSDEFMVMPPPEAGEKLSSEEIETIRKWISEGANYEKHWSFVKPEPPEIPQSLSKPDWPVNDLDRIVLGRLDQENLSPSPEAKPEILIRRVSLLLTGLPPTPEEVDQFVNDTSPDAYEKLVDRLLESPAYGERWARVWLDLARYADSAGYAQDPPRVIWRYRDWVIKAINQNLPFDQFTIEQLAGDMLENPSEDQLIATAFHRNTMTNSEGGTDDEEFRNAAIVDRVNTTMQVWMGLTMGCAQCHTHKYDPITQEEYFQVFAIFNNSQDTDKADEQPFITKLMPDQIERKENLTRKIEELKQQLEQQKKSLKISLPEGKDLLLTRFLRVEHLEPKSFLSLAEVQALTADGKNVALGGKAKQSSQYSNNDPNLGIDGNTDGDFFSAKSTTHTNQEDQPWWEVDLSQSYQLNRVVLWNRTDSNLQSRLNHYRIIGLNENRIPIWGMESRQVPDPSQSFDIPVSSDQLSKEQLATVTDYFEDNSPELDKLKKEIDQNQKALDSIKGVPTPIMRELAEDKQRVTKIQIRGNFQVTGDEVTPGTPKAFHPLSEELKKEKLNRLTFAKWIISEENPLTARVTVNRFWEQLFGQGLVTTSEDFGIQGETPVHPKLLDFLATRLIKDGWDTKKLIKLIVMSSTFKQSSRVTPERLGQDPDNRLFARGPQFRLPAEMIRDNALMISGLLSQKMYGPSVQPRRPNLGLRAAFGASTDWETSKGEDQYRRGLYTSWRRTTPYPSMTTFDAPSREVCTIRRIRTNTPLQALVTLNDPVYVEAAQALARLAVKLPEADNSQKIIFAFRRCLARSPETAEVDRLNALLESLVKQYQQQPEEAKKLATEPLGPAPEKTDIVELAAWTALCNVLLNLDETLSVN